MDLSRIYTPTQKRVRRSKQAAPAEERRGVALVMVLVLTTILGALAADLQNATSVNLQLAANARDQLQAYFHARSAVDLELMFLKLMDQAKPIKDMIPFPLFEMSTVLVSSDSMKGIVSRKSKEPSDEPKHPKHKEAPRDEEENDFGLSDKGFGEFEGSFWVEEVVDENRKININKPARLQQNPVHVMLAGLFADQKYDKLFETVGDTRDPVRNRLEVMANISDWIDPNDSVNPVTILTGDSNNGGSEDTRYAHLPYGANYKPKNAQMSSLAELRMVPGINDEFMRVFGPHLTVWTDDLGININTAEAGTIQAIVNMLTGLPPTPSDAEKFEKFNEQLSIKRAMPPPLNKIKSMADFIALLSGPTVGFKVDPTRQQLLDRSQILRFDDLTSVYRITAVGRVGDATSTITLVWRADGRQGEIRYWREE